MKRIITVATLFVALLFTAQPVQAQKRKKKKKGTPTTKMPRAKGKTIKSITSKCIKMEGLFNMYRDTTNGKTYMLLNDSNLNTEYIHFSYSENGVTGLRLFKGN